MKKINLNTGKLQLKKETVARLNANQMAGIFGGLVESTGSPCNGSGGPACSTQSKSCGGSLQCTIGCPASAACSPLTSSDCETNVTCSLDSCGPTVC